MGPREDRGEAGNLSDAPVFPHTGPKSDPNRETEGAPRTSEESPYQRADGEPTGDQGRLDEGLPAGRQNQTEPHASMWVMYMTHSTSEQVRFGMGADLNALQGEDHAKAETDGHADRGCYLLYHSFLRPHKG